MKRRGTSLVELLVACVLALTFFGLSVQVLAVAARQRHALDDRQTAILAASNAMERLTLLPWEELTQQHAEQLDLATTVAKQLADGRLHVTITDAVADKVQSDEEKDTTLENQLSTKKVVVEVSYNDRSGVTAGTVRLVAWRYGP